MITNTSRWPRVCLRRSLLVAALWLTANTSSAAPARIVTGTDTNSPNPLVRSHSVRTHTTVQAFFAFNQEFQGGVRVATGDINGDGTADIITGAGPGGGPQVRVISGADSSELHSFPAFDIGFTGGISVAAGDVNNDGVPDIITGAGPGATPHVRVFDGTSLEVVHDFIVFEVAFQGGVQVAAGDVNGDGVDDIITGAGPGGGPHVRVFNGKDHSQMDSFLAYAASFNGGVNVATGDVNGDGLADIITGAGAGGGPHVKVFDGRSGSETVQFFAYPVEFTGGVRVASGDITGDGLAEIIVSPGAGAAAAIRVFDAGTQTELSSFFAYEATYAGGVHVAVAPVIRPSLNWSIGRLNQDILFTWPAAEACVLESNKELTAIRGWNAVTLEPVANGDHYEVELPFDGEPTYFRLNCDDEQLPPEPQ